MKKYISILMVSLLACVSFATQKAIVKTYPAPRTEQAYCQYIVKVNGKPVDIYKAYSPQHHIHTGADYYFCSFDFEGEIEVEVKSRTGWGIYVPYWITDKAEIKRMQNTLMSEVYPSNLNVVRTPDVVKIKESKPFKAIVMRNGIVKPLIIFANPLEKNVPNKNDPNVIYFGAGVHYVDKPINLKDNQTLYLEGGAVLRYTGNGGVPFGSNSAKNIAIRGRGIISFDNRGRFMNRGMVIEKCENALIEGIILRDCNNWTLDLRNSNNVLVDNFKICGSRMINDDAIDICNSTNVTIKNTFCRAQDDIIAIKGMRRPDSKKPVENIFIENCMFWTDAANIFRIGYECDAPYFKNIKCKNIYVPFYSRYVKPTEYWSHAVVWLQPTSRMKISDFEIDGLNIRSNGNDMPLLIAEPRKVFHDPDMGCVENCTIKNVVVEGKKGKFRGEVWIRGRSEKYYAKNISVENAIYFGKKKTANDKDVFVGEYTENINVFKK